MAGVNPCCDIPFLTSGTVLLSYTLSFSGGYDVPFPFHIVMIMDLTKMKEMMRMLSADETETGNAEVQPVRDNRLKATNCRVDSGLRLLSHFKVFNDNSELCNAFKKPLGRRPSSHLTVKWFCPFHAEPVQYVLWQA